MKKLFIIGLLTVTMLIPCFAKQSDADREVARTQEFIQATQQKTPQARISALQAYIKKFPDTTKRWTILAYYQLAVNFVQLKDYGKSANYGEKAMKYGVPTGEEARLNLILSEAFGVKDSPVYNKAKALKHAEKAIALAKNDAQVRNAAKKIKKGLTVPPPPSETPEQKMKRLVFQDEEFNAAISYYKTLGAADKGNPAIHETYAAALFKGGKYDSAIKEYETLFAAEKKGIVAYRLAESYAAKAGRVKSNHDKAVRKYIEASLLYADEGSSNEKTAEAKGKRQLFIKYGYFKKMESYNAKLKKNQASASKNEAAISKARRDLRKHRRHMRNTYRDYEPPQYEYDKEEQLEQKIRMLQSGGSADMTAERDALKAEEVRISKEFSNLVKKIKAEM